MKTRVLESGKSRGGALMLLAIAVVLLSGLASTCPAQAETAGYTLPSNVSAKVGETRTLSLTMPQGELCNVSWGTSPSYVSTSNTEFGSYWGKPARTTITCLRAGTTYVNAEVKRFDKQTKQQIGEVTLRARVTIANRGATTSRISQTTTSRSGQSGSKRSVTGVPSWASTTLKSVALSKTRLTLSKGAGEALGPLKTTPTFGAWGQKATWKSSNTRVATVSSGGYVRAVGAGTATITVRLAGKTASCKVTVRGSSQDRQSSTSTGTKQGYLGVSSAYTALNRFRNSNSLGSLSRNAALERTAKIRAKELVSRFSHTRPNGTRCYTAFPASSVKAENIAHGYSSASAVTNAWAKSPGHRANMLNANVNSVGIACYRAGNGKRYWVQCFARM